MPLCRMGIETLLKSGWRNDLVNLFCNINTEKTNVMTSFSQMASDTYSMNADADDYNIHIHNQWSHYLVLHRYQIHAV